MAPASSKGHGHGHGRLHKRGSSSASSITRPTALSQLPDSQAFAFNRSATPKVTYEEPWNQWNEPPARLMSTNAPSVKIKPYLRKLSSHHSTGNSLDLSRPAAENECLAGLGITDEYARSAADVNFTSLNGTRGRHTRSTSNNSQYSAASSLRPTAPPLPPIYQTAPRSFTPPISRSTPASILCSEQEGDGAFTDEDRYTHHGGHPFDSARRSGSISSSTPGVASPLRINTNSSSTKLGGSYSQSSASLTSPLGQASRTRGDTIKTAETTSPSSRTSIDRAFSFMRGGRNSPIDPASRAAEIRLARQTFNEKEEARERKLDKELNKQAERDSRKQFKQEERAMRKSESNDRVINYPYTQSSRSRSFSDSQNEKSTFGRPSFSSRPSYSGRPSIGARLPSDKRRSTLGTAPALAAADDNEKQDFAYPQVSASRAAKGRWLRFVTWFKTRILRMTNRVQSGHA